MPEPTILPGSIVYLHEVTYTSHPKYHLIVSISSELFLVINSDINNTIQMDQIKLSHQVELKKQPNNTYMPKEISYINCYEFEPTLTIGQIKNLIKTGKGTISGQLDKETINKVISVIESSRSPNISSADKTVALRNLKDLVR